jgi:hypothetical protein
MRCTVERHSGTAEQLEGVVPSEEPSKDIEAQEKDCSRLNNTAHSKQQTQLFATKLRYLKSKIVHLAGPMVHAVSAGVSRGGH